MIKVADLTDFGLDFIHLTPSSQKGEQEYSVFYDLLNINPRLKELIVSSRDYNQLILPFRNEIGLFSDIENLRFEFIDSLTAMDIGKNAYIPEDGPIKRILIVLTFIGTLDKTQ